tara:strand:- start:1399 stop:2124 length:726 start_codon:yes stop_codon:yes gene_type:complete
MIDAIYFLSLDRIPKRRRRAIKLLSQVDFCDVYMVDGVDGSKYDFKDFHKEGIVEYKNWERDAKDCMIETDNGMVNMFYWNRPVNKGEVGCALSHFLVWKHAHTFGLKSILVLEDDFYFEYPKFLDGLGVYSKFTSEQDCDIFYLGSKPFIDKNVIDDNIAHCGFAYLLHAYILEKDAIRILLNGGLLENLIPADEYVPASYGKHPRMDIQRLYNFERELNAYRLIDDVVSQDDLFGSQTY